MGNPALVKALVPTFVYVLRAKYEHERRYSIQVRSISLSTITDARYSAHTTDNARIRLIRTNSMTYI